MRGIGLVFDHPDASFFLVKSEKLKVKSVFEDPSVFLVKSEKLKVKSCLTGPLSIF